ncbi:AI-2E family transporter [Mucilaginibacter auburnensis]|uniref:Putative PurR-regulated permease PerM n=1 Tax=Mucilaginibacter auburnensis TaxID=1457233 RepID=A0A2H9VSD3_9SPHI|nr:AI-2E family transporter [Mucilaginibacter auburnensis]PJJ83727.1 putative PurR-regulated permease PerM [Mucilaginibacter auburnensis]
MPQTPPSYLPRISHVLFIIIAATAILFVAKPVLVPLAFALVFAMLLIPLCRRMEKWGINRGLATVLCILLLLLSVAIIIGLLSWQLSSLIDDMGNIEQRITQMVRKLQQYIRDYTGIDRNQQQEMIKEVNKDGSGSMITEITSALTGVMVDGILTIVYIFLLMYFRDHLMQFIRKAVPATQRGNVADMVHCASDVSQKYLTGLAQMIVTLWIMYSIGFSIVGVKSAIFFAVLCGTLEIIPFVGNLTGTAVTVLMGVVQGGDFKLIAGILITYGLVQFIQSYVLEPLVVGRGVNLNPLFTIVGIVIGEAVWGIPGMVLAVPIFGMMKIFFDHFESLKPYGFLLGCNDNEDDSKGIFDKLRGLFTGKK